MNTSKNQVQFFLFFILLTFYSTAVFGQTCNVNKLTTQIDVDNFATNYPGCTCIIPTWTANGFTIGGAFTDITNLDGLSQVTKVGGNMEILGTFITSMNGLENLDSIIGSFRFEGNNLLTDISDLGNLTSVNVLFIRSNDLLPSLIGLNGVSDVDEIWIIGNNSLTNLDGLSGVTHLSQLYISLN